MNLLLKNRRYGEALSHHFFSDKERKISKGGNQRIPFLQFQDRQVILIGFIFVDDRQKKRDDEN